MAPSTEITRITSDPETLRQIANADPETIRAFTSLLNAVNTNLILTKQLAQPTHPPAPYTPPPGSNHPGLDIRIPAPPAPQPATTAARPRRTFTLAQLIRYASATGGIASATTALLALPAAPLLGADTAFTTIGALDIILLAVCLVASFIVARTHRS